MKAEIVTIGDELLIGQVVDTNSAWIGENLNAIGVELERINSISDEAMAIKRTLDEVSQRADLVIMTGGLGPTKDDITKYTLCEYFDDELVHNEGVLNNIRDLFARLGRKSLNERNVQQAMLPSKCKVLNNELGTAAGMWFEKNDCIFVSLPGVPHEMKHLMKDRVLPAVEERFHLPAICHKTIHTYGVPESELATHVEKWESELPDYISLAFLPSPGMVRMRLSARGNDRVQLDKEIAQQFELLISNYFQDIVYSEGNASLEALLGIELERQGKTVATAESCTGGYLAHLITSIPGSSVYYKGSVVAYSNEIKEKVLSVSQDDLIAHGAVSEAVVSQMAVGVRELMGTDYAMASSGIAGPSGGTETKPVGTIWLALAGPEGVKSLKLQLSNDRLFNIRYSARQLLKDLYLSLK